MSKKAAALTTSTFKDKAYAQELKALRALTTKLTASGEATSLLISAGVLTKSGQVKKVLVSKEKTKTAAA